MVGLRLGRLAAARLGMGRDAISRTGSLDGAILHPKSRLSLHCTCAVGPESVWGRPTASLSKMSKALPHQTIREVAVTRARPAPEARCNRDAPDRRPG